MDLRTLFSRLPDPRLPRTRRYPLVDIVLIILVGLLCGSDNLVEIAEWASVRRQWFADRLDIRKIPSHDTLNRVLKRLDPKHLNLCLMELAQLLSTTFPEPTSSEKSVIAFDGKRLKGAQGTLNLVSAWATQSQLTLAVQKVPDDTNEIPVVQAMIKLLEVKNSVVTADAMHCQKETAKAIFDKGGDYVLCFKKNRPKLWETAEHYFEELVPEMGYRVGRAKCVEKAHGKWIETRRCSLATDVGWFDPDEVWSGLRGVAQIEWERRRGEEIKVERRYFLTSLTNATTVLRCSRDHWGIENSQHWRLDVYYREDDSRVRTGNAATNLAMFRRMSLSILKRDKSAKVGTQTRRKIACASDEYRERLLATG